MGNCRSMKEILNIIKFLEIHHIEIILSYIFIQSAIWKKTFSIFNSLLWTEKNQRHNSFVTETCNIIYKKNFLKQNVTNREKDTHPLILKQVFLHILNKTRLFGFLHHNIDNYAFCIIGHRKRYAIVLDTEAGLYVDMQMRSQTQCE